MYGTVVRIHPKPGHEQAVWDLIEEWGRERKPVVPGFVSSHMLTPERSTGELVGFIIFADRESFVANAADPAQDAWYRRWREHMTDDPVWEDGTIVGITA